MIHEVSNEVREIIRDHFLVSKKINERFSLRGLALKLDMPVSFLSDFLNGKRKLTEDRAQKVIGLLNISEDKKAILLDRLNSKTPIIRSIISDSRSSR